LRPRKERHLRREFGGFSPSCESREDSMVDKRERSAQSKQNLTTIDAENVIYLVISRSRGKAIKNTSRGSIACAALCVVKGGNDMDKNEGPRGSSHVICSLVSWHMIP
jgi:hypothetical protein